MREPSLFIHKILTKIPGWLLFAPAVLCRIRKPLKYRVLSFDLFYDTFFHQRKSYTKVQFTKSRDLFISALLLFLIIIRRKSDDYEFIFILFTEFLKIVILAGITTVGCRVYQHYFLPFQLFKIKN